MNIRGHVIRVVDGDTLWVRVRVRLASTSTPELGSREGGIAHEALRRRWPTGEAVQLIASGVDGYGRIIADLVPDDSGL